MSEGNNRTTWTQDFTVRTYETDAHARLRVDVLCDYLQDAAANHAEALGVGGATLAETGLTWVLSRLILELEPMPSWRDTVRIETWPSGVQGIFATRDFVVSSGTNVVARATTAWFVIDVARRRPARLPQRVVEFDLPTRPRSLIDEFERFAPMTHGSAAATAHRVGHSEIDMNRHVNHVRFVGWLLDAVPEQFRSAHRLRRGQFQFRNEAHPGDLLTALAQRDAAEGFSYRHDITLDSGTPAAQALTDWLPRES